MRKMLLVVLLLPAALFVACGGNDGKGGTPIPTEAIKGYIESNYPGAVIRGVERDAKNLVDVDILHGGTKKDVYFSIGGGWMCTTWDVPEPSLPQAVIDAVVAACPDFVIDDTDYVQTPAGDYYRIDIEKGNFEKHLKVALDGSSIDEV